VNLKQTISESASRMLGRRTTPVRLSGGKRMSPYLVAVLAVCGAILLKLALRPIARHDEAALGFFAAVMFASYFGGLVPGLLATALSAVASDFLFLTPVNTFSIWHWADGLRLTQFLVEGGLISTMGGSLRKAQQRAETERRRVEAANHAKDDFLATVSHELRTPLGAILGWTHLLKTSTGMDSDKLDAADAIERNARMQSQLIEDLLDISRITGGRMRLALRPMRPAQSIRAAIETVSPAASAKGVTITSDVQPVGLVAGDPDRLQQIVWNLIANAIKFTSAGGTVRVRLYAENAQVIMQVSDTGIGIAPEFLPHLFERFEQADTGVTRRHAGLGLGLAIVRHLVELHGGTVDAHSDGLGHGSTFSVMLPQLEPPDDANEPALAIGSRRSPRSRPALKSYSCRPPR
jgi:signal transduction histidine kinase